MKYALVVGNDQYTDQKLSRLKTPAADARELVKVMSNEKIGGFETNSLINRSEAEVRRAISEFLASKKPDDLVLVYFSGHGVLDGRGRLFLAFKDTFSNNLSGTAIPSSFITDIMDDCRSKRQVLVLDCCHSGAFARIGKKAGEQNAITKTTFEGNGYGRAVLTASNSLQFALEGDQVVSHTYLSLFTHFLLEGLKTGDADRDGDGNISLDEWFDYTYSKVVSTTSTQSPQKWIYEQEGKLLIAKNPNVKKNLPVELLQVLDHPYPDIRLISITKLAGFLRSQDPEMTKLAQSKLEILQKDSSPDVAQAARNVLQGYKQPLNQELIITPKKQKTFSGNILPDYIGKKPPSKSVKPAQKQHLRVFLNHSFQDKPIVRDLYQKLRAEGWIEPWLDEENLLPGQDWNLMIEKAIRGAHVILVCLSKNSINKEGYIQRELRLALDHAFSLPEGASFIIPIRLDECELPRTLQKFQYLDYFGSQRDRAFQRLLTALKVRLDQLNIS